MEKQYTHKEYPKWVYSEEKPDGLLLKSEHDLEFLEGDWYESPEELPLHIRDK